MQQLLFLHSALGIETRRAGRAACILRSATCAVLAKHRSQKPSESIKVVDQKVYALKEPNLDFIAKTFAESEFEKYRIVQDKLFKSDFDKFLKETKEIESDEARESLLPFL